MQTMERIMTRQKRLALAQQQLNKIHAALKQMNQGENGDIMSCHLMSCDVWLHDTRYVRSCIM